MEHTRPATIDDLDRIVALAAEGEAELLPMRGGRLWAVREARPGPRAEVLAAAIADPDQCVVVGEIGSYVTGYGTARTEKLRDGSILGVVDDIYVEDPFRGIGVGEEIMNRLVEWCRDRGCVGVDSIALPGNRDTKNFFERFGLKARALLVHRSFVDDDGSASAGSRESVDEDDVTGV